MLRKSVFSAVATTSADACDSSTFPSSYNNTVFVGLHRRNATSAAECQQACCDEGDACAVWQWADQAPASPIGSCWVGPKGLRYKTDHKGWVSYGAPGLAPTPSPTPAPLPPSPPGPTRPVPTSAMLRWMQDERGAIGHFNMGTFQSCGIGMELLEGHLDAGDDLSSRGLQVPPPEAFAPTAVDADSWMEALASVGITRAVLVVSHGCGFNTFPSRTRFPEFGFEYNYSIAQSPWKNGTGDIAAEFVAAARRHGIRPGFYHGAQNNAFLHVVHGSVQDGPACSFCPDITQEQYKQVLLGNLRQLWTDYGELAEVWFDAGVPKDFGDSIADLLRELQPNAVAFQGPGPNGIRFVGTESGHVKYPFWSTAKSSLDKGQGEPDGAGFHPGEADTCFQGGRKSNNLEGPYGGCWFYNEGMVPKSLGELVSHYHDSVGRNAFMLLDWTPMKNGTMREDHVKRYKEFGDWLHGCYATPIMAVESPSGTSTTLLLPEAAEVDRIVIEEDLTAGEHIRSYNVTLDGVLVANGTSVGHKRIDFLEGGALKGKELKLTVSGDDGAALARVAAHNCSRIPGSTGCDIVQDFRYTIYEDITIKTLRGSYLKQCCDACRRDSTCAVFVLDAESICTLLSMNHGGESAKGAVSGSPKGGAASTIVV